MTRHAPRRISASLQTGICAIAFAAFLRTPAAAPVSTPKPTPSVASIPAAADSQEMIKNERLAAEASLLKQRNDSLARLDSIQAAMVQRQLSRVRPSDSITLAKLQTRLDSISRVDSLRGARQMLEIAARRESLSGYPVYMGNDTLFLVYMNTGAFTAVDRAAAIIARLKKMAAAKSFFPDSLVYVPEETGVDIAYRGTTVMTVSDMDALWNNASKDSLARAYGAAMKRSAVAFRREHSLIAYVGSGAAILALLASCIALAVFLRRLAATATNRIVTRRNALLKGVSIKNVSLLSRDRQLRIVIQAIRVLEIAAYFVLLYATLSILFFILPWTKDISKTLVDWVVHPVKTIARGIVEYLPKLFNVAVIVIVTQLAVRVAKKVFDEIGKGTLKVRGFYEDWARPTFNIVRFLLYAFMLILIFPYLPGSESPAFRGVTVFLGVLLSLGSTSAVANVVAGLAITYMRPFRVGDRIRIGEVTGDVMEKTMLVTRIRTLKNEDVTIPNAGILSGHTVNFSTAGKGRGLIVHTAVTIGYGVPWRSVHAALTEAALSTQGILSEPRPFVLQTSLDDFYVTYEINAFTDQPHDMAAIYSRLHENIQDAFGKANIEITSPHYRAVRSGGASTVPQKG
jgi:small-conductance mechanosensitive channel